MENYDLKTLTAPFVVRKRLQTVQRIDVGAVTNKNLLAKSRRCRVPTGVKHNWKLTWSLHHIL
jgi:hypothetical protein